MIGYDSQATIWSNGQKYFMKIFTALLSVIDDQTRLKEISKTWERHSKILKSETSILSLEQAMATLHYK